MIALHERKKLPHDIPSWVQSGAIWFVTINTFPKGSNYLCRPDLACAIWQSVQFNAERGLWWPHLFLLMPDHWHGLFGFRVETGLRKIVSDWKHYTAHKMGICWQRDFFDHRLRKDEAFDEKAYYIRQNPVRKGLVAQAEEWQYVWIMDKDKTAVGGLSRCNPVKAEATALPSELEGRDGGPSPSVEKAAVKGLTAMPEYK